MRIEYTTRNYNCTDIPDDVAEVLRKYATDNNLTLFEAFMAFFYEEVDQEIYEPVAYFFQDFFDYEYTDDCETDFDTVVDD